MEIGLSPAFGWILFVPFQLAVGTGVRWVTADAAVPPPPSARLLGGVVPAAQTCGRPADGRSTPGPGCDPRGRRLPPGSLVRVAGSSRRRERGVGPATSHAFHSPVPGRLIGVSPHVASAGIRALHRQGTDHRTDVISPFPRATGAIRVAHDELSVSRDTVCRCAEPRRLANSSECGQAATDWNGIGAGVVDRVQLLNPALAGVLGRGSQEDISSPSSRHRRRRIHRPGTRPFPRSPWVPGARAGPLERRR